MQYLCLILHLKNKQKKYSIEKVNAKEDYSHSVSLQNTVHSS